MRSTPFLLPGLLLLLSGTLLTAQTLQVVGQPQQYTVSRLPSATVNTGSVLWVTDSNTTTVGATCTGGGANYVPCLSNGTNWLVQSVGASGTVTSLSAGSLSPLFTSSVATATTTPALSFTLSTAGAHNFLGNNTGSTAAPAYVQPAFADLSGTATTTQLPNIPITGGGTGATTAAGAITNLDILPDTTSNGLVSRTAANATVARTLQATSGGAMTWTNGDGVSGNPTPAFILPSKILLRTAACQSGTAYAFVSLPSTSSPVPSCATGTNTNYGLLTFSATGQTIQDHFKLPPDFSGAIDVDFIYRSAGITGNVVWNIATAFNADTATGDPTFNTAQTVSTAAQGTTLRWKTASLTGITQTGAAANSEFHFKIGLDATTTTTGNIDLIEVRFTIRRTL